MKIKATVITDLNEREERPSVNASIYSYYKKGDSVTIIDIVKGDPYEGNDVWYKLKNQRYIWSGGVSELIYTEEPEKSVVMTNYNSSFEFIPAEIRVTEGRSVKVVLIDSGIQDHECLGDAIKGKYAASGLGTFDKLGHGTFLSGIIGGRNKTLAEGVIGIAPSCELFVAKAIDKISLFKITAVTKALDWAINEVGADIINFSLNISDYGQPGKKEAFQDLVQSAREKNILLVASAGENSSLLKPVISFPASQEEFISAGALSDTEIAAEKLKGKVRFIMPLLEYRSAFTGSAGYVNDQGSSVSTAIVSGLLALIKSGMPAGTGWADIVQTLEDSCDPYTTSSELTNPYSLFKL